MLVAVLVGYVMLAVTAGAERRSPFDSAGLRLGPADGRGADLVQDGVDAHAWQGLRAGREKCSEEELEHGSGGESGGVMDYCLLEAASLSSPQKGKNAWGDEHL